jgi:hypothetical protein
MFAMNHVRTGEIHLSIGTIQRISRTQLLRASD